MKRTNAAVATPAPQPPGGRAMSEITVRPAQPEEYTVVGELSVAAYVGGGLIDADDGYVQHLRDAAWRAANAELFVAVDADGVVLGSVTVAPYGVKATRIARSGELEFLMLATAPAAQRRGVGELLTHAALDRARELGCARVVISVVDNNTKALRLYQRLGFGRLPDRDWDPAPDLHTLGFTFEL